MPLVVCIIEGGWVGTDIMEKRLLSALFLTLRNFATFNVSLRQSNGRCSWVCYTEQSSYLHVSADAVWMYLHIGVGFGVARFTIQGNAKASKCGTSDSTDSRAFSF